MDTLYVRLLDEQGKPTDAARAVYAWKQKLEDYPVADESDLSELECEDENETWTNCYRHDFQSLLEEKFGERAEDLTDAQLDRMFYDAEPEWSHDSGGCYVNLERIVEGIEELPSE